MKVFNACMLIMKRRMGAFAVYFAIFLALSVVMTAFGTQQYLTDFSEIKSNFTVINRDGDSAYASGLIKLLSRHGVHIPLQDEKTVLQDATFYHATDYILILPDGFARNINQMEKPPLETITTPDSAKGYYTDSLVNQYFNFIFAYRQANPSLPDQELVDAVLQDLSLQSPVQMKSFTQSAPVNQNFQVFHRMESYIIIVLITLCISTILMVFRRPDLNMRNLCAPTPPRSRTGQLILCGSVVSVSAWLLLNLAGFILCGSKLAGTDIRIILLILLNSFIFMIVALSIAVFASTFIHGNNTQNAVSNFLSLGLCFLGGIFVPLELFGKEMLAIAHFLPTYWYVSTLDTICALTGFQWESLAGVYQGMLIQLGFAAAIFCAVLVINKYKSQSEKSFGSTQTELEA